MPPEHHLSASLNLFFSYGKDNKNIVLFSCRGNSLENNHGDLENTTYHEFGHHAMYRLQNNHIAWPYGEDFTNHSWWEENTSTLAWVEGWADFIQMVLDGAYHAEDNEFGHDDYYNYGYTYELRNHKSWPNSWNITNGYRSEYYIACALYDLWDGPSKGLPEVITHPYHTYHGWNDTGLSSYLSTTGWATVDDIEFDFNTLCQPLIQHGSQSEKTRNIQEYITYLLEEVDNCEQAADISRAMQENRVQFNAHEYQWGWHNSNLSTDELDITEQVTEDPSPVGGSYTVDYEVTLYNKENNVAYPVPEGCITDDIYLGIWDDYSSIYRNVDLFFNVVNIGLSHQVNDTYGKNRILLKNGTLYLGGTQTTAELNINSESFFWNRDHGELIIQDGSTLYIKSGATLRLGAGSTTEIQGAGKIVIEDGGYLCVEPGASIELISSDSKIVINDESLIGTNPDLEFNQPSNCHMPWEIQYIGEGKIDYNCYVFYEGYTHTDLVHITSPTTWNNVHYQLKQNILIYPSAELIINNSTIELSSDARIMVAVGAKLIVDNSTITNLEFCGKPWPGMQIWGNSSNHQYQDASGNYQQGYVELRNNSIIENAWEAVQPWMPEFWNNTGGIINADNVTFRNNRRAVQFISYENFDPVSGEHRPNQSTFKNCTFETNLDFDGLFEERPFSTFVSMYDVDGVRFYGCDFKDIRTNFYEPFLQSVGIWTIDANYYVLPQCSDYYYNCWNCPVTNIERSTFTGLNIGTYSTKANTSNTYVIDRVDFSNNTWGNLNVGNNNVTCIRSNYEVGTKQTSAPYHRVVGIFNLYGTGFTFHQNNFFPHQNLQSNIDFHTGIWNHSTGNDFNAIFSNDFTNMGYGNIASGDNNNIELKLIGLNYQCNTNTSNQKYDFYIYGGEGVSSFQGIEEVAAGNTFCHNITPEGSDFQNYGKTAVNYFYYNGNNENPVNYTNLYPETAPQNDCNEVFGSTSHIKLTATEKDFYRQQYYFNKAEYDNTLYLYEDLKDGGDTPGTTLDIETAWPDETWELRAQLLADSPHLSKEVLYAAADKTDVLPHTIMFEICIANPEEMRDEEFLSYLETKDDPMPTYMVNDLREGADEDTYKSVLQNEMAGYVKLWGTACNYLIRDIVLDSTGIKYDSLRLWLGNKESLNGAYEIVDSYMAQDSLTTAMSYLTDIPNNFDLTADQLTEYNYFYDLKNTLITAQQQGRNILQLDSLEVLDLVYIADTSLFIAGAQAQSILNFGYGYSYFMLPDLPNEPNMKQSKIVENNNGEWTKTKNEDHFITAFPNPASTWVTFEYTLPYLVESATIEVTDISGKPVKTIAVDRPFGQTTWDTRNIKTGLYIYSLKVNNNTIDQRKLIINNK